MHRCDLLAEYTEEPGRITRRFLTPPMRKVHASLGEWMQAAGLMTHIDNAGNMIGRRSSSTGKRTLLVGSHLDTVPGAGRYDGVLGVVMGVALAQALGDAPLPFHLDILGFSEEEGCRFGEPYLGSSALAGSFSPAWLDRADAKGTSVRESLTAFGCDPNHIAKCEYSAADVIGYVEPHLEQGPVLELAERSVGVVNAIVGQSRVTVEFLGAAGHAGTTPITGRHDALVAAAEFVAYVRRASLKVEDLRATVGKLEVSPNAPNVIPERVSLSLDVRHQQDSIRESSLDELLAEAKNIAQREGCRFSILHSADQSAVAVDTGLTKVLTEAVSEVAGPPLSLPSGAGHDAVVMAQRFPMAMLFLRHPGGISHSPEERVGAMDVAVGIEVLVRLIHRLAEIHNPKNLATESA